MGKRLWDIFLSPCANQKGIHSLHAFCTSNLFKLVELVYSVRANEVNDILMGINAVADIRGQGV